MQTQLAVVHTEDKPRSHRGDLEGKRCMHAFFISRPAARVIWVYLDVEGYASSPDAFEPLSQSVPASALNLNCSSNSAMAVYRPAGTPFNHESADVILRSTDNVDFRVHKGILAIASPFFSDMFALGKGAGEPAKPVSSEDSDGLEVIPMMAEDSEVLDKLLRFSYPVSPPALHTLDELKPVLTAALKYQFELAVECLRSTLVSSTFLSKEPLRVFAIARQHGLDKETSVVAPYVLRQGLPGPFVDELKEIPASALHRLWELQRRCSSLTVSLATDFKWLSTTKGIDKRWVFFRCSCSASDVTLSIDGQDMVPRAWWKAYMQRAEMALRNNQSATSVTSSAILWPTLKAMANCTFCGSGQGMDDIRAFSEVFAREIDKTVLEIAEGIKWD
ncbi:hypothetical protein OE88DRAFT_1664459 [Heliocybe sulcata]|uniref:BTB domain-containing protein n=1 Tax=Heliocybe sulcata TaxID=5364 RepID=A0A5C3N476_9AGAM|nr:hypothetical protein OE88DRAFT_1664459 [Heliocybe sulcata]